jgi:hypothetical protein
MELVPPTVAEKDLRDEVNHRTHKAGYTDRDGQPMVRGIRSRVPSDEYRANYVRIFGHD